MSTRANLFASALATGTAELVTSPICTVKTKMQAASEPLTASQAYTLIVKQSGKRGLFWASGVSVASQVLTTSSKYTLYRFWQPQGKITPLHEKLLTGMGVGLTVSLVSHPVDVLRVIWQNQQTWQQNLAGFGMRDHLRLCYRGYSKSALKASTSGLLYLPIYDGVRTLLPDSAFVSALVSATISTIVIHPLDYLKTRHAAGAVPTLDHGAFRGLSLNLARVVPHFAIVMTLTEAIVSKQNVEQLH